MKMKMGQKNDGVCWIPANYTCSITVPLSSCCCTRPSWYTQLPSLLLVLFLFLFFISHFPFFLSLSSFLILYHPVPNGISTSIPLFTFYNLPLSQLSSLSIVIGWFSFPPPIPLP